MNEEEAKAKLKELGTQPAGFCPWISGTCRTDCVCYGSAYKSAPPTYGGESPNFSIIPASCGIANALSTLEYGIFQG